MCFVLAATQDAGRLLVIDHLPEKAIGIPWLKFHGDVQLRVDPFRDRNLLEETGTVYLVTKDARKLKTVSRLLGIGSYCRFGELQGLFVVSKPLLDLRLEVPNLRLLIVIT